VKAVCKSVCGPAGLAKKDSRNKWKGAFFRLVVAQFSACRPRRWLPHYMGFTRLTGPCTPIFPLFENSRPIKLRFLRATRVVNRIPRSGSVLQAIRRFLAPDLPAFFNFRFAPNAAIQYQHHPRSLPGTRCRCAFNRSHICCWCSSSGPGSLPGTLGAAGTLGTEAIRTEPITPWMQPMNPNSSIDETFDKFGRAPPTSNTNYRRFRASTCSPVQLVILGRMPTINLPIFAWHRGVWSWYDVIRDRRHRGRSVLHPPDSGHSSRRKTSKR
jgi:hypothetical protein